MIQEAEMFQMTVNDFLMAIVISLLVMGILSMGAGIIILVFKVMGDDLKTIAMQTAKMAQKGLADEISGLVGNASVLIDALNQLIRTTTGIGAFLALFGFMLFMIAYTMLLRIN
jgi:hypothetical protein